MIKSIIFEIKLDSGKKIRETVIPVDDIQCYTHREETNDTDAYTEIFMKSGGGAIMVSGKSCPDCIEKLRAIFVETEETTTEDKTETKATCADCGKELILNLDWYFACYRNKKRAYLCCRCAEEEKQQPKPAQAHCRKCVEEIDKTKLHIVIPGSGFMEYECGPCFLDEQANEIINKAEGTAKIAFDYAMPGNRSEYAGRFMSSVLKEIEEKRKIEYEKPEEGEYFTMADFILRPGKRTLSHSADPEDITLIFDFSFVKSKGSIKKDGVFETHYRKATLEEMHRDIDLWFEKNAGEVMYEK